MKTIENRTERTCTCGNHQMIAEFEVCDICMGVPSFDKYLGDILPEPVYDDAYFEELDSFYEGYDAAA